MLMRNRYPIYIVSKGRWEQRLTAKGLEKRKIEYRIVVEPQEYEEYAKVIEPKRILVLPFSNLGQGSIPARNWIWEHSISEGHARHWILDDNMPHFLRMNNNHREYCNSVGIFCAAEDFVDRYENVAIAGFNYMNFAHDRVEMPPYKLNTRIYSCILLKNDLPYRWRGRYNEDTDLSIRALKDGWCTVLFNAFLVDKTGTMRNSGGNTDELYKDDGRLKMAQSLVDQHPEIVTIKWKFNRWQHHVDYTPFKNNKLIRKEGIVIPQGINEYGMVFKKVPKDKDLLKAGKLYEKY